MDETKKLINQNILFAIEHLRKKLEGLPFCEQKQQMCESIELLTRAYQNVNNKRQED